MNLRWTQEMQRSGNATLTKRYRLSLLPYAIDDLIPLPMANQTVGRAAHEVHGIQLNFTQQQEVTLLRDDWDTSSQTVGTSHFLLHPDVKLVNVRVIELYANPLTANPQYPCPGAGTTYCGSPGWIGHARTRALLDDLWEIDVDPSSTPGQTPSQVVTSRTVAASCAAWPSGCTAPPEDPPDEVFVPCKIQFKMSRYESCQVSQSVFVNLDPIHACNELLNLNAIDQAVSACSGAAKAGELTVVYVGALTHPGHTCIDPSGAAFLVKGKASGDFSSPGNPPRVYMTSYGHQDDLTLAHEIGHTLGLSHVATEGNLMHANMDLNGPALTASQCQQSYGALP